MTSNSIALDVPVKMGRFCDGIPDCIQTSSFGAVLDVFQEDECNAACHKESSVVCKKYPDILSIDPFPNEYSITCTLDDVSELMSLN